MTAPSVAAAQSIPAGIPADTLHLHTDRGAATSVAYGTTLSVGERVAAWVENRIVAGNPSARGQPVPDAPAGQLIARFGGSAPFAWPAAAIVWTAPATGRLSFAINAARGHELSGDARVTVVYLGLDGSPAQGAFPRPSLTLERVGGSVRAAYLDRAGFGLDRRRLAITVTTSRGTIHHLAAWAPVGDTATTLPLPPAGLDLPIGLHTLTATITDRLGNESPPATITFGTP